MINYYKLNSELLSNYDFEKIISLLGDDKGSFNREFWDCIKHNISNISEVFEWIRVIDEPININIDIDYEYLNIAQESYQMSHGILKLGING